METKTIEVILGQKVEGDVDPALVAPKGQTPPEGDVEGRYNYWKYVECPYTGDVGRYWVSSEIYRYYTCCFCDRLMKL